MLDGRKVAEVQIDSSTTVPQIALLKTLKMNFVKNATSGTFYYDPELGQVNQYVANTVAEMTMEIPAVPGRIAHASQIRVISQRKFSQKIVEDSGQPRIAMR